MQVARIFVLSLCVFLLASCSCFNKDGQGVGDGNIPEASTGDVLKDVHYAFDSSALTDEAKAILAENAAWLNANADKTVVVEGHCDERGTVEYNLALGERRAKASYDYLRGLGVAESRMSTISYGEELPLDAGHTEAAWSQNRRSHFAVK
ncbi:MAG: peptidoglycan-associated lipoprotein Pal [Deltaproteobacteria bacterium]|nr:peptidoglycan-associated lipoprotein Pal [Deltaproteobacteria bacterium]